MSDRELLELAAKAAGIQVPKHNPQGWCGVDPNGLGVFRMNCDGTRADFRWNPLTDDGDALRLAVKLQFDIAIGETIQVAWWGPDGSLEWTDGEAWLAPEAQVRSAIVRAAAEIGRAMA